MSIPREIFYIPCMQDNAGDTAGIEVYEFIRA